jgi:TetR/AcrR family tetracycline transcriptional repressor
MVFVSSPADEPLPPPPRLAGRVRAGDSARTPLSRERIVDAALAIVDADGLDALNMRRVAADLGTGPASLYAHVAGKEELLDLCVDRVATGLQIPDPDPDRWEEQVKGFVRDLHHSLLEHRDLARASLARIPTAPATLQVVDRVLALLRAGGLPDQVVAWASDLLPQFAVTSAYEASLFLDRMASDEGERYLRELGEYFAALPPERFPNITALAGPLMHDPAPDARFEFGLDVIVRGLSALRTG